MHARPILRCVGFVFVSMLAAIGRSATVLGEDWKIASKEDFVRCYAPGAQQLEAFYSRTWMKARSTKMLSREAVPIELYLNMRCSDGRFLLEERPRFAGDALKRVLVVARENTFQYMTDTSNGSTVLERADRPYNLGVKAIRTRFPVAFAAFCTINTRVVDLLAYDHVTFETVLCEGRATEDRITLKLRVTGEPRSGGPDTIFLTFLPQSCWALKSWKRGAGDSWDGADIDYTSMVGDVPVITRLTRWHEEESTRTSSRTVDVDFCEHVETPRETFNYVAAGIRQLGRQRSRSWRPSVEFVAGIIVVGLALMVRRLASAKHSASAS